MAINHRGFGEAGQRWLVQLKPDPLDGGSSTLLDALGNIGDFVGGLAVIASLLYLATQVRSATQQQRTDSFQAGLGRVNEWYRSISNNSDVARIYLEGRADFESLGNEDQIRFHALIVEVLVVCEMMYRMGEGDLLNAPTLRAVGRFISDLFENPGVKTWWQKQGRSVFTEDFRVYVESEAAA